MSERIYYAVENLEEITRNEFEKVKKDKQKLLAENSHYFIWSTGAERIAYMFHAGKFYKAEMSVDDMINTNELHANFDYIGVNISKPVGVFMRKDNKMARSPAATVS